MKKLSVSTLSLCLLVSMNAFGAGTAGSSSSSSASSSSSSMSSQIEIPGTGSGMLSNNNIIITYDAIYDGAIVDMHRFEIKRKEKAPNHLIFSPDGRFLFDCIGTPRVTGTKIKLFMTLFNAATKQQPRVANLTRKELKALHQQKEHDSYLREASKKKQPPMKQLSNDPSFPSRFDTLETYITAYTYSKLIPSLGDLRMRQDADDDSIAAVYSTIDRLDILFQAHKLRGKEPWEILACVNLLFPDDDLDYTGYISIRNKAYIIVARNYNEPKIQLWQWQSSTSSFESIGTWKLDKGPWRITNFTPCTNEKKIAVLLSRGGDEQLSNDNTIKTKILIWEFPTPIETLQEKCSRIIREHQLDVSLLPQLIVDKIYPYSEHKPEENSKRRREIKPSEISRIACRILRYI